MREEVSYGRKVYDDNGVLLGYEAGRTDEGMIFKDEDAFLNHPDKICYIPEVAFDDKWFIPVAAAKDEGETRDTIIKQVKDTFAEDYLLTEKQVEFYAEDVFYFAEWACICTYLAENFDLWDAIAWDDERGNGLFSQFQKEAIKNQMTPKEWQECLNTI